MGILESGGTVLYLDCGGGYIMVCFSKLTELYPKKSEPYTITIFYIWYAQLYMFIFIQFIII